MKIKALVSFAGAVDMNIGDIAEIDEKTAVSLISCGFAEEADGEENETVGNNGRKRKKGAEN